MGSLKVLTLLLVLLVLVPAGVLAWLGFRSADVLDREVQARVQRELDEVEEALLRGGARIGAAIDARMAQWAEEAAAAVYRELPLGEPHEVLDAIHKRMERDLPNPRGHVEGLASAWPPVWALRLVDAEGRGIVPREHRPVDRAASDATWSTLVEDLRHEASRRYFAGRDLDAAQDVWREARGRFGTDVLRATADVEIALLAAGAGEGHLATLAREIEQTWSSDILARVGRPIIRLWLLAAPGDSPTWSRLAEAEGRGLLDTVPLTSMERIRARQYARAARSTGALPDAGLPIPGDENRVVVGAVVAGGAVLEVLFDEGWAWDWFATDLMDAVDLGHVRGSIGPPADDAADPRRAEGIEWSRDFEGPAWGGRTAEYRFTHQGIVDLVANIQSRRRLTVIGVGALLLLVVVGIALVGRTVRRERAARRLRDDFIANVSHELRTPLTSVCLHAEMLAEEDPAPDRRRNLARVVRAEGSRLAALVDDLLDFAALERGVRTIEPEPLDLAAAVRAAVDPYRTLADRDGVELGVDVEDGTLDALADAHGLSRILANLLSNAWRHGRPSRDGAPGRIHVGAWEREGVPTVEVRDDGAGIPPAERTLVFERFRRGGAAGRVEGTGLGLALGRELASGMGGNLTLVEDDEATIFRLTLPPVPDLEER